MCFCCPTDCCYTSGQRFYHLVPAVFDDCLRCTVCRSDVLEVCCLLLIFQQMYSLSEVCVLMFNLKRKWIVGVKGVYLRVKAENESGYKCCNTISAMQLLNWTRQEWHLFLRIICRTSSYSSWFQMCRVSVSNFRSILTFAQAIWCLYLSIKMCGYFRIWNFCDFCPRKVLKCRWMQLFDRCVK